MKKNPLVSIIVCTKSRIGTLKTALESIFNQSLNNYEVIVVLSTRSEDNSNDFLVDLKSQDMIKLAFNNGNRIDARNIGISLATGKYVCFVDDDDVILRNRLEVQINYLINHLDVDVVGCTTMIDAGSAIANTLIEQSPSDILRILESGEDIDTVINFQSCMFKRSIFETYYKDKEPFDQLFIAGGEGQFLLYDMIINHGVHFGNTPNTIYVYHVGAAPNSLSGNVDPVFYNEHIYGKPWEEKRQFVRNFDVLFAHKENFDNILSYTTAEMELSTTSEHVNPYSIKIDEEIIEIPSEEPTKKPRKPRVKKEKPTEAPTEVTTEKPKRGRKKKVIEETTEAPTEAPKKRGRKKKIE